MLFIISTPIGNLNDLSKRTIDTINECDLLLCEDTRRTIKLLNHINIKKKLISYNDFCSDKKEKQIIEELKNNKNFGLISDSGTPLISDPGYKLIINAINNEIKITTIPGPTALIAALTVSGCTCDKFNFKGFMPKKKSDKFKIIESLKLEKTTNIFYESPYRIKETMRLISESIPNRKACIAREITKIHEEIIRGSIKKIYNDIKEKNLKGEIVIVIDKLDSK